ncbi:hypothetical protein BCAR13_520169 [Paraburkholderia caribensis]|nr:hypothetical protein BCAR13_520169 [Paraburkholderia caribensis]
MGQRKAYVHDSVNNHTYCFGENARRRTPAALILGQEQPFERQTCGTGERRFLAASRQCHQRFARRRPAI